MGVWVCPLSSPFKGWKFVADPFPVTGADNKDVTFQGNGKSVSHRQPFTGPKNRVALSQIP